MRNYKLFNQEIAELYKEVKDYSIKNYSEDFRNFTDRYKTGKEFMDALMEYTSKVCEFQLFVRDHKSDAEAIQNKSKELFGIETVTESLGYNLEMYDKMQILLNYAEPVKSLFNYINLLVDIKNPEIPVSAETLIKEVIEAKGLSGFMISKKSSDIEEKEPLDAVIEDILPQSPQVVEDGVDA